MAKLRERVGIVAPRRTPIGRIGGVLAGIEAWELQVAAFRRTLADAGINAADFTPDDVIVGNVCNSIGNIARHAATGAGIPQSVPAVTVDRQCASGMEALALAAARIGAGLADCILIGGTESASRAPWLYEKTDRAFAYAAPQPLRVRFVAGDAADPPMGETAEILADEFSVAREEMDACAAESHRRATAAHQQGIFAGEMAPLSIPQRKGDPLVIDQDECVRADTTAAVLAKLRPVFRKDGRVTAGNSSPMNDGAASAIVASESWLAARGIRPDAWLRDVVAVGLEARRMGMAPAVAIPRLLERNALDASSIHLYEINEAFAAQVLAVNRELKLPADRLNIHGGAIALGHPLGASGLRIVATLVNALRHTGQSLGIAALCIGGGQGMAALIERA